MAAERIVRSVLLSAALAPGVVGCPPEPPDDDDAGMGGSAPTGGTTLTGGRATGGTVTGGTATAGAGGAAGGTAVSVCQIVTALPEQGSACDLSYRGVSQCLANGDRCVCVHDVWYCNTECAKIPEPVPGSDCSSHRGAACNYANGVGCTCPTNPLRNNRWTCMANSSSCPAVVTTADDCAQPGTSCDYIGTISEVCECFPDSSASTGSSWTCLVSGYCPANQPAYPTACTSTRFCPYGNVLCTCMLGGNWVCDWPFILGFSPD